MNKFLHWLKCRHWFCSMTLLICLASFPASANPLGGSVAQGSATFTTSGGQFTVRTSDRAYINWQSFNIGLGETTTFVQPSSSSLVWNRIHDANPSQILGNLNANGYVVLQNESGFYIGGDASIQTRGLMLTTSQLAMPDLYTSSAWQFNALPPMARIINYGEIKIGDGGFAFLIANAIENHGQITAPDGSIGLYAGKEVWVSERPDGRGLSAKVTLPAGSVDNTGRLVADGGTIAMRAAVVNQGGLVQANSVREVNGVIELFASDTVNLDSGSVISARGDATGVSSGGSVAIKADNRFTDVAGSEINITGGARGGNGGNLEISAAYLDRIQSAINGSAIGGFLGGALTIDPTDINLNGAFIGAFSGFSTIDIQADNDITLSTVWTLSDSDGAASLSLSAGNNIIFNNATSIRAGRNWAVNLTAGTDASASAEFINGFTRLRGLYLDGNSFVQVLNGDVRVLANHEVIINPGPEYTIGTGTPGNNGIRTMAGGNISVTALTGDVNTGGNFNGYLFGQTATPYYRVSSTLGGISTFAGGNVEIKAGGDVTSFLPLQNNYNTARNDAGSGAFGAAPGNVTIEAGGSVYGHYVVANGVGTITAGKSATGGNVGQAAQGLALSLIKGRWKVHARTATDVSVTDLKGNIYLQDVRNPNGIFNDLTLAGYAGYHGFDYDPYASVWLDAANAVVINSVGSPHLPPSVGVGVTPVPLLFPPSLIVNAGAGGLTLDQTVILFPSAFGEVNITSAGDLTGKPDLAGAFPSLQMSDSGASQWLGPGSFNEKDHASSPLESDNPNPVLINIGGNINTINLRTTKATQLSVGGDMINSSFVGVNLTKDDTTVITVAGQIFNTPAYVFADLTQKITSPDPLNPNWDTLFRLLVDPARVAAINVPSGLSASALKDLATSMRLFTDAGRPQFVYNPEVLRLGYLGVMPENVRSIMQGTLTALRYGPDGLPLVQGGHFVTTTASFVPASVIESLYESSQNIPKEVSRGYQISGPGHFNITAASMNLGNSYGIVSRGIGDPDTTGLRYASVAGFTDWLAAGADVNVTLSGNLDMLTSTISSLYGGNVNVESTGGELNLGSQELFGDSSRPAFGIYTSGHSDVNVTAAGDINIEGSRIAAYNGGNINILSRDGNVNVGTGGNSTVRVPLVSFNPASGKVTSATPIYGSGIVAVSLPRAQQTAGGNPLPGNITVTTPKGDITASSAGILQLALDGNVAGGPMVVLTAGTPADGDTPAIVGNIDLGSSGLIGSSVEATAQGNIHGLIISSQSSSINAAQNFSGTVLSGGTASLSAGGSVSGTVIGVGGVSASGGGGISANILGQNVSVNGGASQSTLGTTAAATATGQAAAQQASNDAKQQVASNNLDDEDEKKKGTKRPVLTRRSRVTVILPPS